jgi:hypothetical protein
VKSSIVYAFFHLSFVVLVVAGCSPEEPVRTVSWFREHPEERKAILARCSDDPGHLRQTPNCVNASQAEGQESIGHWKDLPPLDLPLPEKRPEKGDDHPQVRP